MYAWKAMSNLCIIKYNDQNLTGVNEYLDMEFFSCIYSLFPRGEETQSVLGYYIVSTSALLSV